MSRREIDIIAAIQSVGAAIAPLHRPIPPLRGNDWLAVHDEPGQTFLEYLASDPVLPTRSRTTLCVQPIGDFQPLHSRAIAATVDLLGRFYRVPVWLLDPIGTRIVPGWARQRNPFTRNEQFLTGFLLDHLARDKPTDAVAVLALTTTDLWPGGGAISPARRVRRDVWAGTREGLLAAIGTRRAEEWCGLIEPSVASALSRRLGSI
jgi:archaemetzincin